MEIAGVHTCVHAHTCAHTHTHSYRVRESALLLHACLPPPLDAPGNNLLTCRFGGEAFLSLATFQLDSARSQATDKPTQRGGKGSSSRLDGKNLSIKMP